MRGRQRGATPPILLFQRGLTFGIPLIINWANGQTSIRYIENIIVPYVVATRKNLGLGDEHTAVVIFDSFRGHEGDEMESILSKNNILAVIIPSNCTDLLQPLDISVNKPLITWQSHEASGPYIEFRYAVNHCRSTTSDMVCSKPELPDCSCYSTGFVLVFWSAWLLCI